MTIYLDVLIVTNLFITYILLCSCDLLLQKKGSRKRRIAAAVLGGFSSLVILLPPLPGPVLLLQKLVISVVIAMTAFGLRPGKLLLKRTAAFYLVSFLYAGGMSALWLFVTPAGMQYRNGVAYFHVSAVVLVLSTVAVYLILTLLSRLFRRTPRQEQTVSVRLECDGRETLLTAFVDTGNQLRDVMSGIPVAVCELGALRGFVPEEVFAALSDGRLERVEAAPWQRRLRMIPAGSVTGERLLPGFKPDRMDVCREGQPERECAALVAVTGQPLSDGEFQMLVGMSLLEIE